MRGLLRALILGAAAAIAAGSGAPAAARCPAPGTPAVEPYRWYPALDLARIPFHRAEGPWGPRAPVEAPAAPATVRTVRVTSAAQLQAEAQTPGTTIVVDAAYIGPVALLFDLTDIDIVVPPQRTLAQLTIGRYEPPSATRRLRIRGETPGRHSGGVVGNITVYSNPTTDIIVDGVDLNGADGKSGGALWHFARSVQRAAIVNSRGHAAGAASLQQGANIVLAGNRLLSGARRPQDHPTPEGWGIRGGDRLVVFDNRIEGNRFHRVRVHPRPGPPQYAWLADNVFVDAHEARIFSAFAMGDGSRFSGVWAVCNRVYAHSTCMPPSFEAPDAAYAELTHNAFFGSATDSMQRALQGRHGAGRDYVTGNTYNPWQPPPAWTPPGDPREVPLPPALAAGRGSLPHTLHCPPP